MAALLEHLNFTVTDTAKTAAWMQTVFGWHIRWEGGSIHDGYSIHVGTKERYLALYHPPTPLQTNCDPYTQRGGLNHIAVVVDDLDRTEAAVRTQGFKIGEHYDYEPGRRFYFHDHDGIEFEVVQYD